MSDTMEMFAACFDNEEQADEALKDFQTMHREGSIDLIDAVVVVHGSDGKVRFHETADPGGKTWAKVGTGVPVYFESTPSNTALQGLFALSEEDMIFTLDILHMEASTDIQTGDVIQQLPAAAGSAAYAANIWWAIRGNPRPKILRANKLSIIGARLEKPPVGVGA